MVLKWLKKKVTDDKGLSSLWSDKKNKSKLKTNTKLDKKNADFKKMKSGDMTREQFIKKYPNSGTARREKGKKWRPVHSEKTLKQLKNKNADFKKMRSGKMSKEAFIKKYPNSVTAREAEKNRRKPTTRKSRFKDSKKLTKNEIKYPTRGTFRGM